MKAAWHLLLWPYFIGTSAFAAATEPQAKINTQPRSGKLVQVQAPADAEFWELYDELADDNGHLPAPEEIPPPQDQLVPSNESKSAAESEDL